MGGLFSRRPKELDTMVVLEGLSEKIEQLEAKKKSNVESQKRTVTYLVAYSILGYLVMALIWYFCFVSHDWLMKVKYATPLLIFPLIILAIKRILHWYFVKRISGNEIQLEELKEQKMKILDEVMENETYKKAVEILAKFGTKDKKDDEGLDNNKEVPEETFPDTKGGELEETTLRRRLVSNNNNPNNAETTTTATTAKPVQRLMMRPMPIRPILKQNRTIMDKLVDYLLGDGPHNRFALICNECKSHNGMALQEEFEYLSFRCVYCSTFNPSRKQKPFAPKLDLHATNQKLLRREAPPTKDESKLNGEPLNPVAEEDDDDAGPDDE